MTTPYTPEERERAAKDWQARIDTQWDKRPPFGLAQAREWAAEDLQMRLNRLERREAEARELLSLARAASQTIAHKAEWARRNAAWLSEEGV